MSVRNIQRIKLEDMAIVMYMYTHKELFAVFFVLLINITSNHVI